MDARVTALEAALDHVMTHVLVHAKDVGTVAPISNGKALVALSSWALPFIFELLLVWEIFRVHFAYYNTQSFFQ